VHLGVVLVHPHKKFELNWSKNDRVMADFRRKITFFYRSLYIQLCPIGLIFFVELQWACGHSHREFQLIRTMGTVEKWEFSWIWHWIWPILTYILKFSFLIVHCISNIVRSSSFFLWSCTRPVGIPTGNFSSFGRWERWKSGNFPIFGTGLGDYNLFILNFSFFRLINL
jgi:hypothetical protein